MNCASQKVTKLFAELDSKKGAGLILRVRQGQGRPSRIYVKKFIPKEQAGPDPPCFLIFKSLDF